MATDKKISALTELAEAPAVDDELAIVDKSATETKKITSANLMANKANIDQAMHIGTTEVAINRASATLNLAGIGTLDCGAITSTGAITSANSKTRAYRATTNQAISNETYTKIELNAESYDTQSEFDSTTNYRFTAKVAGYYQVIGGARITALDADKILIVRLTKNGSEYSRSQVVMGGTYNLQASDIIPLDVDDYLELFVWHNHGADRNIAFGENATFMAISRIA